jgi:hypothetical protein
MFLDSILRMLTGRLGGLPSNLIVTTAAPVEQASKFLALDANVPLQIANQWYHRLTRIAAISDRRKRDAEITQFETDVGGIIANTKPKFFLGLVSRKKRSELVGDLLLSNFLPAITAVFDAQDRNQTKLVLVRVAAALAVHRARSGTYASKLDELAPTVLPILPIDPYSGKPLIYRRRGDGYVLYSVFKNGVDDGGSDAFNDIENGEWVSPDDDYIPSVDAGDLVIRLPMPAINAG